MPKHSYFIHSNSSENNPITQAVNKAVLDALGMDGILASSTGLWGINFMSRKFIEDADFVVADISRLNDQVVYEIGVAQGAKRPIIFIEDSKAKASYFKSGIQKLIYDSGNPEDFEVRLLKLAQSALINPEEFSSSTKKKPGKQNLFVSYCHRDSNFLERLLVHLRPLAKEGRISPWVDTMLRAGDDWKSEIQKALYASGCAVLLVSADFLASNFIVDNELPPLLDGARENGVRIIPVIIKPCRFVRDPNLNRFQAINDPEKAMILLSEGDQEKIYDNIASEIERSLRD